MMWIATYFKQRWTSIYFIFSFSNLTIFIE